MAILKIAIFFILCPINTNILSAPEDNEFMSRLRLLYTNQHGGSMTAAIVAAGSLDIEIEGFLTIDLGALLYVDEVLLQSTMRGSVELNVETHYHRMAMSQRNRCSRQLIKERNQIFRCQKLCRKILIMGTLLLGQVSIAGFNTYHDNNLGCFINDHFLTARESRVITIEDCIRSCGTRNFGTSFFSQEATLGCHCLNDSSIRPKTSNRFCTTACSRRYQICGGDTFFTAYSTGENVIEYDDARVWNCLYNSSQCLECPEVNGYTCNMEDIDECAIPNICGPSSECTNLPGTFWCHCPKGMAMDVLNFECTDFDECSEDRNICRNGGCVNLVGSYSCRCYDGFVAHGYLCEDIDECTTVNCGVDKQCLNTVGSYECKCLTGYILIDGKCGDLDECNTIPGICAKGECVNEIGSYNCTCDVGYFRRNNTCFDVDECVERANLCQNGKCKNTEGSYVCDCHSGFTNVDRLRQQCVDTDECQEFCINGVCINSLGSFQCKCNDGYVLEEMHCVDIDECMTEHKKCGDYTCDNTIGSFKCLCPEGMIESKDYIHTYCEDLDECARVNECQEISICINTPGSYVCHCLEGYKNIDAKNCTKNIFEVSDENDVDNWYATEDSKDNRQTVYYSADVILKVISCSIILLAIALLHYYWKKSKSRRHETSSKSMS